MDRLYRPTLLLLAVAITALSLREAGFRQRARSAPPAADRAADEASQSYSPRLLELPKGVVPVALSFAPPPPAPLGATERQIAEAHAARLMNVPAPQPQRLPPAPVAALPPAGVSARLPLLSQEAEVVDAPPAQPTFDAWEGLLPDPSTHGPAVGPELAPPQFGSSSGGKSIIQRVQPISDSPARPDWAEQPAAPAREDPLLTVDNRARRMVDHAFLVAQRGAVYTARGELIQALRMMAQALDAAQGTQAHTESLAAAFRALEEGEAFQTQSSRPDAAPNLRNLVAGHRTPVLKNADLQRLTALEAMQQYYTFAQEQFAAAADRRPAGSLALYGLGKLHMAMAEKPAGGAALDLPKAMVYHQAALLVDPQNHLAANELGVLLARYEQWEEAKRVFLHSLAVNPLPQTWHNLAVVHDHLGETSLAAQARFEIGQLARSTPGAVLPRSGPDVRWLSPADFAGTGETPGPVSLGSEDPLQASQGPRPGDVEWWKPWTWF